MVVANTAGKGAGSGVGNNPKESQGAISEEAMTQRILIIEDDERIRQELKTLLETYQYGVVVAEDFSRVVEFALEQDPHLVLLDLNLPFYDGYHVCREMRKCSRVPIIIVTSKDSEMDELMCLNLGADNFVTKPYNTSILMAKITALLDRAYGSTEARVLRFDDLSLDLGMGSVTYCGKTAELTKNESRILQVLIENDGRITSREEIMDALWQTDAFVDDNTLTVNINRLRKKLATVGADNFIKTRRGQGYLL
ncbi:MAG: response regulator transcription factor [Coriobacteriales bacterium]|jgi:DNA-binding response OmpR family regulator|nr:response regulator transcription factor [Coriobacteriales bacterium]